MTATNMCSNIDGFRCSPPLSYGSRRKQVRDKESILTNSTIFLALIFVVGFWGGGVCSLMTLAKYSRHNK